MFYFVMGSKRIIEIIIHQLHQMQLFQPFRKFELVIHNMLGVAHLDFKINP